MESDADAAVGLDRADGMNEDIAAEGRPAPSVERVALTLTESLASTSLHLQPLETRLQTSRMATKGSAGAGLSKEDTKTEHPLQAILLADAWGEEQRWGPLVRRKRTDDEEYEDTDVGGEQRPWVSPSRALAAPRQRARPKGCSRPIGAGAGAAEVVRELSTTLSSSHRNGT